MIKRSTWRIIQDMGMEQPAWQQQGMLGSDMERLMVTMQAVEQACSGLQVQSV